MLSGGVAMSKFQKKTIYHGNMIRLPGYNLTTDDTVCIGSFEKAEIKKYKYIMPK